MKDKRKHEVKTQSKCKSRSSTGAMSQKYQQAKTWKDDQFWENSNYSEKGKKIWKEFLQNQIELASKGTSVIYETIKNGKRISVIRLDTSLDKTPLTNR